jgi:hypothetical protein
LAAPAPDAVAQGTPASLASIPDGPGAKPGRPPPKPILPDFPARFCLRRKMPEMTGSRRQANDTSHNRLRPGTLPAPLRGETRLQQTADDLGRFEPFKSAGIHGCTPRASSSSMTPLAIKRSISAAAMAPPAIPIPMAFAVASSVMMILRLNGRTIHPTTMSSSSGLRRSALFLGDGGVPAVSRSDRA